MSTVEREEAKHMPVYSVEKSTVELNERAFEAG